ncbi:MULTISPECIES: DUF6484 domain-containing protein [unclassified Pseudomonas]|uniref:DUF6484 domain-containing protein n=1 Tax=unclassified Pseudomonas TaxID=196821 RepID=UPI00244763D2|nr:MULTISPECIES: DUF6484 domain-containing protein [unclassified Pseudomonas]MDH0895911.1 DUF6484 domain-containing protein [Pseudomonas sp. GD03875]MDH1067182.1 DUF6484 domain-containing protein [Pseudomonas sp. GD03985]
MKTEVRGPSETGADSTTPLNDLLQRPAQNRAQIPERAEGIVIGRLSAIDADGRVHIAIPQFGLDDLIAPSLVALGAEHVGHPLALGFESANPHRPIILGLMLATPAPAAPNELEIRRDAERIVIEAESELELRCGEAVILLTADGHIQLRGGYITSHASASQRIRGGSVQIN